MQPDRLDEVNSILVKLFNDVMKQEEKALIVGEFSDISVNDMHIIEAVGTDGLRTMSQISRLLDITMGTLTIGINGLVKKGYVQRVRGEKDKRIVYAQLTDKGIRAYNHHAEFHNNLAKTVMDNLDDAQKKILIEMLGKLDGFFED